MKREVMPLDDKEYVVYYANKLKDDNRLFSQQNKLIESQFKASSELFRNTFGTSKEFRKNARAYLRKINLL